MKLSRISICFSIYRSLTLIIIVLVAGCDDGYLRGSVEKSEDGKTYLVVVDDNGGQCGPLFVDNKLWEHKINEAGIINPGVHTIKCGTEISFEIPEGVVFRFDYWGP